MVIPSPDVICRDPSSFWDNEGEDSSIDGPKNTANILNLDHRTNKFKLVDEHKLYKDPSNSNHSFTYQISINTNTLRVFHQNIRGLKHKTDKLINAVGPELPHVLCLTEHHINPLERNNIIMDHYNLGVIYHRKSLSKGGVCIFVHDSIRYVSINLDRFCLDQIIEICAVKLQSAGQNICIVAIYRRPSGNFVHFLNSLDRVLNTICGPGVEFIICGDININYLQDTPKKKQLNSLLLSFNIFSIIDFPTRSQNNSVSLIDNIFIEYSQVGKYQVFLLNTGLSDHDAQLLIIRNIHLQIHKHKNSLISARTFNKRSLLNFKIQLSYEMWEDVFNGNDTDTIFNSFLNTYLRIFFSSFLLNKYKLVLRLMLKTG
jgi:exonuclease III